MAAVSNKLERYDLVDRIAVGGMAEVFRAKAHGAHGFEKTLAIKRILPELAQDPEFEARFIDEAKLAVQLSHANIVQIFDFGRIGGTLFIAMEYVDGLDLAAIHQRYRTRGELFPVKAAFQVAIDMARGLDFAHKFHVVHRDVSPSNILVSRAGEVKIADFGIAQAVAEVPTRAPHQRQIMGKWRYMSPEQTRGDDLTTRSDLFSAASVMYELFTGAKLFPGDEVEEIIDNIHHMEIPQASSRRAGLPEALDAVLARALERRPQDRPETAAEMLRELTRISYESSLVVTALDVAEAIGAVDSRPARKLTAPPLRIDDLIRNQLGDAPVHSRRTDVVSTPAQDDDSFAADEVLNHSVSHRTDARTTIVRRGTGHDGVTLWELDAQSANLEPTVAAAPAAIRRAHTAEVSPIVEAPASQPASQPKRRWVVPLVALLSAIAAASVWRLSSPAHEKVPVAIPSAPIDAGMFDAASVARLVAIHIRSVPPGATVVIDGTKLPDPTPTRGLIRVGKPYQVVLQREGYAEQVKNGPVSTGQPVDMSFTLVPLRARLNVVTRPRNATVTLSGDHLGQTPLSRRDLMPGNGKVLRISKKGYKSVRLQVDLSVEEPTVVNRTLTELPKYGHVQIRMKSNDWANILFRGRKVGRAPTRLLKLPVGKHRLVFRTPERPDRFLNVVVLEGKTSKYSL